MTRIFKFGGASVKDAKAVKNVVQILKLFPKDNIAIVVSAMGKTTNALEALLNSYMDSKKEKDSLIEEMRNFHYGIMDGLFANRDHEAYKKVDHVFHELNESLLVKPSENYDYEYDQIVCLGEVISTIIVSEYMNQAGVENRWIDARNLIKTDNTYRDAKILWNQTTLNCSSEIDFSKCKVYLTQGFIGSTLENLSTTLGREGSDYSAAIIAYCLDADEVTIWKDVPGVLNADPKYFAKTVKIDLLTYYDAIELAYYGASVIHPKTIKPLQNKNIPLYVKSFVNPSAEGTTVKDCTVSNPIPSFIFKVNQTLITISPKDFSFIVEENLRDIFQIFSDLRVKVNVMQNTALSFSVSIDHDERKLAKIIDTLESKFTVKYNTGLELITIRHYDQETIERVSLNKEIILEEKSRHTVQLVARKA